MTEGHQYLTYTYFRGRVGLAAALGALGVKSGDQVATQAFTCVAVPEGIAACGAQPLWIDVEPSGVNMSAVSLAERVTSATRAIIVQHTFGIPADLVPILAVAREHGIPVIEDCCHTFRSRLSGVEVGTLGEAAFYSFEWGKPIVAGVGGALRVNNQMLDATIRRDYQALKSPSALRVLRIHLQYAAFRLLYRPSLYWQVRAVFRVLSKTGIAEGNYNAVDSTVSPEFGLRMADSVKARASRQIRNLDRLVERSHRHASMYRDQIRSDRVQHIKCLPDSDPVYVRYPLLAFDKQRLIANARANSIEMAEWYSSPIHPLNAGEWKAVGYSAGDCPNAEKAASSIVSLPLSRQTHDADVVRAIDFLNRGGDSSAT